MAKVVVENKANVAKSSTSDSTGGGGTSKNNNVAPAPAPSAPGAALPTPSTSSTNLEGGETTAAAAAAGGVMAEREGFSNTVEFLLTSLGFAVGLGNIWRFPTRAYENGGSAFLIPYITCAILFGLPALYLEFAVGQHQGTSPPIIFRRIMPILEGVGWMGAIVAALVAVYYVVIIAWILIYILNVFRGHTAYWTQCSNEWNDPITCVEMFSQKYCLGSEPLNWNMSHPVPAQMVYIRGACHDVDTFRNVNLISATEQYFTRNILRPSAGLFDLRGLNDQTLIAMTIAWTLTGLMILKGVKLMGKISYVTVIVPYFLVIVLFIRGVTLDGSSEGLNYYLGRPDFSKVFTRKSWSDALKQLVFSLSAGHGGLMSMASYNDRKSNCFKNAATVIIADTLMSLIGGAAVFSTLGFLAKQRNVAVPDVVESGLSLAFVVYPEAISQMPIPFLWSFLFFTMLLLLGLSTEMALVEVVCSCLYDQFHFLREHRWIAVSTWCLFLYMVGLIFSTSAGYYWFQLFDEYSAGFSAIIAILAETIVIMYLYGGRHFLDDITEMIGKPKSTVEKYIGAHSPYFIWNWRILIPLLGVVLVILSFIRDYPFNHDPEKYPMMFDIMGWIVAFLPLIVALFFAIFNVIWFYKSGYPLRSLFMLQKQHVSFVRISENYEGRQKELADKLPDNEPWDSPAEYADLDKKSSKTNRPAEEAVVNV